MSLYPDGSGNANWESMRVVLPRRDSSLQVFKVPVNKVSKRLYTPDLTDF